MDTDRLVLDGAVADAGATARVSRWLDLVRAHRAGLGCAEVVSENDFPTAAGLASSASAFAALALAATRAAGLTLTEAELSVLARRGSGSAARSLFGGYVEMRAGEQPDGTDAFAVRTHSAEHWPLAVVIALTARGPKKVSSTVGMNHTTSTSPYFDAWCDTVEPAIVAAREAVEARNFSALAQVAEASALQMHASAIAATPGVLYWTGTTVDVVHAVRRLRDEDGVPAFFTIDAGPHVKVFTLPGVVDTVREVISAVPGVYDTIVATIAGDAHQPLVPR
jgi:diphosphomevalonate decarboxylase